MTWQQMKDWLNLNDADEQELRAVYNQDPQARARGSFDDFATDLFISTQRVNNAGDRQFRDAVKNFANSEAGQREKAKN